MISFEVLQGADCSNTEMQIFPVFDENGVLVLPCRRQACVYETGKNYLTPCANAQCEKPFQPSCPGILYCSQECFEATNTQTEWAEVKPETAIERKKRQAKECQKRYWATPNGQIKKCLQNKRCHLRRKEAGKSTAYYAKRKTIQQHAGVISVEGSPIAMTKPPPVADSVVAKTTPTTKREESPTIPVIVSLPKTLPIKPVLPVEDTLQSVFILEESESKEMLCRYPGCSERISDKHTFWGKERMFCSKEHRGKMDLLFRRMKRFFEITRCIFLHSVLGYLRLVAGRLPPKVC